MLQACEEGGQHLGRVLLVGVLQHVLHVGHQAEPDVVQQAVWRRKINVFSSISNIHFYAFNSVINFITARSTIECMREGGISPTLGLECVHLILGRDLFEYEKNIFITE